MTTEAELRKDVEAYVYEVLKLIGTANALMDMRGGGPLIGECPAALLEANLIHARVLISFFLPTSATRLDDITAAGFIGLPFEVNGDVVNRLKKVRRQLDKHLAHLTTERRTKSTGHAIVVIASDLLGLHRRFLEQLKEHQPVRVSWFSILGPFVEDFGERYLNQSGSPLNMPSH